MPPTIKRLTEASQNLQYAFATLDNPDTNLTQAVQQMLEAVEVACYVEPGPHNTPQQNKWRIEDLQQEVRLLRVKLAEATRPTLPA